MATMLTLHCKEKNEVVSVKNNDSCLLVNIYEQEDGMLINIQDNTVNVECLIHQTQDALALYTDLMAGKIISVDDIFTGVPDDMEDKGEDEDEDEDDDNDGDWQPKKK